MDADIPSIPGARFIRCEDQSELRRFIGILEEQGGDLLEVISRFRRTDGEPHKTIFDVQYRCDKEIKLEGTNGTTTQAG